MLDKRRVIRTSSWPRRSSQKHSVVFVHFCWNRRRFLFVYRWTGRHSFRCTVGNISGVFSHTSRNTVHKEQKRFISNISPGIWTRQTKPLYSRIIWRRTLIVYVGSRIPSPKTTWWNVYWLVGLEPIQLQMLYACLPITTIWLKLQTWRNKTESNFYYQNLAFSPHQI